MKTLILSILLLQSIGGYAQKITEAGIDRFTGEKRIQTDWVTLDRPTNLTGIGARLRTVDTTIFISFGGNIGTGTVGTMDATTFLFNDKTTFKVYPTDVQTTKVIAGIECFDQQYYISRAQLEILAKNNPVAVRRSFSQNYIDIDIESGLGSNISELAGMVLKEMDKN